MATSLGLSITGTGSYLPGRPYTNAALSRVMETSDEWIVQRTGIRQRHYAADGVGASDLGVEAARVALADARLEPEDIDYVVLATMTPDYVFPGVAPILASKLGMVGVPALDIRQQCVAMIYALQVSDALLASGSASRILVVGAEAHAGFMPWSDWALLENEGGSPPRPQAWARATEHRALAILFGDGAGAWVLERKPGNRGILAIDVHSDGNDFDKLYMPIGFHKRPFLTERDIAEDEHVPRMKGRTLFRQAVKLLPKSVQKCCDRAGVGLSDIDLFIAHQANQRINEAVREALGVSEDRVPSNIARVGNTSAATIPILYDELARGNRIKEGMLICFLALGAGLHWGSALFRA